MSAEPHRRSREADLAVSTDQRIRYIRWILERHWPAVLHPAVLQVIRGQLAKAGWAGAERARDEAAA